VWLCYGYLGSVVMLWVFNGCDYAMGIWGMWLFYGYLRGVVMLCVFKGYGYIMGIKGCGYVMEI
jgi:hypothetical protein